MTLRVPDRRRPTTRPWWATAALSAGVIALCYGFARYAYGLFVPQFGESFRLGVVGIGVLGGLSTAGYAAGLLAAPAAAARSARWTTLGSGALAAAGLALMGLSSTVVVFGAGLVVAGGSAGLVSPGVAQLVREGVERGDRVRTQTWANTGTSLGLAVAAFTPLLIVGWHSVWLGFAALSAVMTLAAWWGLPRTGSGTRDDGAASRRATGPVTPLLLNSVLLGLTSAPYWTFSTSRVLDAGLSTTASTWCWFAIGAFGPLGGLAGYATERFGLRWANLGNWTLWAAGIALLALPSLGPVGSVASAAVFGATYMALSGLCILWGARLYPELPSRGVTLSFLGLGVGQTLGSPLAGTLADEIGLGPVFALTALVSLLAWSQMHRALRPPDEHPARGHAGHGAAR